MNDPAAMEEAKGTEIAYCTCLGQYQPNHIGPISVSFTRREDKVKLMKGKHNLPTGIYVNDEFPIQVKRNREN